MATRKEHDSANRSPGAEAVHHGRINVDEEKALDRSKRYWIAHLVKSYRGVLTFEEILDTCRAAECAVREGFRREVAKIGTFYSVVVRRRVSDQLRKIGCVACDQCGGQGRLGEERCPHCAKGWKPRREIQIDYWDTLIAHAQEDDCVDPQMPFALPPDCWDRMTAALQRLVRAIEGRLNERERLIWWNSMKGPPDNLSTADLADQLGISPANVRKILERSRKIVQAVVHEHWPGQT